MREICTSGSEGGRAGNRSAYPTRKRGRFSNITFRDPCRGRTTSRHPDPVAARLRRLPPATLRHASGVQMRRQRPACGMGRRTKWKAAPSSPHSK